MMMMLNRKGKEMKKRGRKRRERKEETLRQKAKSKGDYYISPLMPTVTSQLNCKIF